jgi:hypothetical protein
VAADLGEFLLGALWKLAAAALPCLACFFSMSVIPYSYVGLWCASRMPSDVPGTGDPIIEGLPLVGPHSMWDMLFTVAFIALVGFLGPLCALSTSVGRQVACGWFLVLRCLTAAFSIWWEVTAYSSTDVTRHAQGTSYWPAPLVLLCVHAPVLLAVGMLLRDERKALRMPWQCRLARTSGAYAGGLVVTWVIWSLWVWPLIRP